MPTQDQEIAKILSELEGLQAEISDLRAQRDATLVKESAALSRIEDKFDDFDNWATVLRTLDDVPGLRVPKWYKVEIPFEFGDKQSKFESTQISATGPFVCTQMQAYYRITDTTASHYVSPLPSIETVTSNARGRLLQPTAYNATVFKYARAYSYGFVAPGIFPQEFIGDLFSSYVEGPPFNELQRGEGWNYPDFDVSIELANSNRLWTGRQKIPSAALYGVYGPLYLGAPGLVMPADSIVVHASPTTDTVHLSGVFTLVFHGYQICAHLSPSVLESL